MYNQIEFVEFSQPYMNPHIEEEFRFGKGRAYGLELMARKDEGKLTGWVSYTLSKSERKIKDMQETNWYLSPYDQTHNVSVVAMYDLTKKINVSTTWVYNTGKPFDAPSAKWQYGNMVLPYYDGKNASRYPNYHRLDLSVEYKFNPNSLFQSSLSLSIYNAYNRKNANVIYFKAEEGNVTQAYRVAMMQRMFALSYNLSF
jgi:predicted porin